MAKKKEDKTNGWDVVITDKTNGWDVVITISMLIAFWTGWFRIESAIMFLALCVLLTFERDGVKVKIEKR